jgi:ubiquinone/menaquinone biosynthesis C-methylase UbiE
LQIGSDLSTLHAVHESLKTETERLTRMWMRHDQAWLGEYLVSGVEDPRLNVQSVLSRHSLTRVLFGDKFGELMHEELRFCAVMNWLTRLPGINQNPEEATLILHALTRGADNAEGLSIPRFVVQTFATLPTAFEPFSVPNYIESFLKLIEAGANPTSSGHDNPLDSFAHLWNSALSKMSENSPRLSTLEPACGSANEYRFFRTYGLARFLDYSGFDLCEKNIVNARELEADAQFSVGNVFEIAAPDRAFDWCIVNDLFEHLSLEGMHAAISEVCRVSRQGICAGFFQMDEIPEHLVRPLSEYFCNRLSREQTARAFAEHGFEAQVIHIETFLRAELGWGDTHNPFAHTFVLRRT